MKFQFKEDRIMMQYQKWLQQIICLKLVIIFLAGCGVAQAEPTMTAPPVPPTLTPSPVPPTPQPTLEVQEPDVESQAEPETPAEPPTITLSDGEELVLVTGRYDDPSSRFWQVGYGVEGGTITSPGPTIKMRKGDTVTITFENAYYLEDGTPVDEASHNFAIVADKEVNWMRMEPLWGAHVGGFGDPNLIVGERGSVTFTAEDTGSFFYVSANVGHVEHGMWGRFIVEE
jgi:plastocyanin